MKVGDIVRVSTKSGNRIGILVKERKHYRMVGPCVEVMIEGVVKTYVLENVSLVKIEGKK